MHSLLAIRVALAAGLFAIASFAFAHAMPRQQSPAPNATVSAPHEVVIEFGEALEASFSSISVTDAHGKDVGASKSVVDAHDPKRMSVALGELAPGAYQVKWTAVADDGHRTQGHYSFTVK
jgi:methionine-rich copper-binding protein CopC